MNPDTNQVVLAIVVPNANQKRKVVSARPYHVNFKTICQEPCESTDDSRPPPPKSLKMHQDIFVIHPACCDPSSCYSCCFCGSFCFCNASPVPFLVHPPPFQKENVIVLANVVEIAPVVETPKKKPRNARFSISFLLRFRLFEFE